MRRASHIAAVCVLAAVPAARAAAQASQAAPLPPRAVAVIRDSVRAVLKRAYADSAFPGAYAMVGSRNAIYASMGVGHLDWAPSPAPTENTMYDMASLTKVVGTTTAMMQLYESGAIGLDDPVQKYLPNWVGPHKNLVTVRNLLTHSSGLPPYKLFYKALKSPAATMAMVYATPLDTLPGVRMVYSDIGAILMGEIVRRVSGDRLDHYLAEHVFRPLGMASTMFNPPLALLPRIAPTEYEAWRDTLVRGEVHDENAYELGGVAGHAGLFSTAHDLGIFAQMMLNGGTYHGIHVLLPATIATFTTVQDSAFSNRALGWEVPDATNSAGHLMSSHAFGHTGFTGTSIWIDPPRNLFIILLSNRVDPTRDNKKIYGVRVELADAVGAVVNAAEHGRSGTAKRTP
ncbi:MAG TPA: serine hydrolase [Gemmatimonadaceae bacterium]|nr:serine hydrolase [Gemmatimonadaceae bacterium]